MNRKSQLTMLMIVGLVLFIVISLALYLSKSVVKKQSQQNIKRTQESAIETQPVKEYVTKCVDKLAKDAIILLGRQGGYIYSSQGGTLVDYADTDEGLFFVHHDNFKDVYNILPAKFTAPPYSSMIPEYPWRTFPYRTQASNAEIFDGFFGISNMPPLNSSEGANSIQYQIGAFVNNNLAACADFSIFEKQNMELKMEPAETSVLIGSGDVSVRVKARITIMNTATKEAAELSDFSTSIDMRLKDLYFFAREMIGSDIGNIRFDMKSDKNSKDFFNVRLIEDIHSNDDLIIITDEKSLIYGKPYEYVFARRNRAPALHYIRKNILEFPHGFTISESNLLQNQKLKAEDPDEDSYTFTITPQLPKLLNLPQINFKIEVSDGQLSDYQTITVNRI